MYRRVVHFCWIFCNSLVLGGFPKNIAWNGGPIHLKCEHGSDFWTTSGQYVKENIIAIKAVTYLDEIYVITPRMKRGVLATVWLIVHGSQGVELQPFPELRDHEIHDCGKIQNAVDFTLDHLGNLWVLDTGIVDSLETPRCTCPPKVVAISILLNKIVKRVDLSPLSEPTSLLQNVLVEYGLCGKVFIYVTDAARGAILVFDTSSDTQWTVLVCSPAVGLQFSMVKRGLAHSILILTRLHHPGILELDTASIKRKSSISPPLRSYEEHAKPVYLLGSGVHHVYLRHTECSDVLSWDIRKVYDPSELQNIHSSGPRMISTSVTVDPIKQILLVLDSNYGDNVYGSDPIYHKITFIDKHFSR